MIHIDQGQAIPENPSLKVFSVSGDYSDNDLIECCGLDNTNIPVASFQAQFIKYGGLVYRFNEPEELGQAIVAIDPVSTHDSALLFSEEEARRLKRLAGNLLPENQVLADEAVSPIAQEALRQEALDPTVIDKDDPASTQPAIDVPPENSLETPVIVPPVIDTSTSTPPIIDTGISTTTPPVIDTSTSTPPIIDTGISTTTPPVIDTSTSTPPVTP